MIVNLYLGKIKKIETIAIFANVFLNYFFPFHSSNLIEFFMSFLQTKETK